MSAFLFYRGVVQQGQLHEFVRRVKALQAYRKSRAYCVPEALYALEIHTFPAVVIIDRRGRNFHETARSQWRRV